MKFDIIEIKISKPNLFLNLNKTKPSNSNKVRIIELRTQTKL